MDAINTLILKLITCSACTCTTGKVLIYYSSPTRAFQGGMGFFGSLVVILINFRQSVVFFQGKYEPQSIVFIQRMFLNVSCSQDQVKGKEYFWFCGEKK